MSAAAFGRLVDLVRGNLGPDAQASLARSLRDRRTRALHEVDAVIEGSFGEQAVTVCLELHDDTRPADEIWVDTMCDKHRRLDTTVLLLASRTGFSAAARQVAEHHGIGIFSLHALNESAVHALLGPRGSLWPLRAAVSIDRVVARVAANALLEPTSVLVDPDRMLHAEGGAALCNMRELVESLVGHPLARDQLVATARDGWPRMGVDWASPMDGNGRPLFLKKLLPRSSRRIDLISMFGLCEVRVGRFGTRHGMPDRVIVKWPRPGRRTEGDAIRPLPGMPAGNRPLLRFYGSPARPRHETEP